MQIRYMITVKILNTQCVALGAKQGICNWKKKTFKILSIIKLLFLACWNRGRQIAVAQ